MDRIPKSNFLIVFHKHFLYLKNGNVPLGRVYTNIHSNRIFLKLWDVLMNKQLE
jgi:hypothetical protein